MKSITLSISQLKVACILDEFSYECFKHECNLFQIEHGNWEKQLIKNRPHLLLVESAWRGNNGNWQRKIANYHVDQENEELKQLVSWCRKNNIKTVFWNKEDPVHFDLYFNSAKLFDYIFTTDKNCIEKYRKKVGHNRVFTLPFAAQPKIHHPIRVNGYKQKNLFFAGSYYGNQHKERRIEMNKLLSVASIYGLEIYDRNYHRKSSGFKYPVSFQKYIVGSLPYDQLVQQYKKYKIGLNVNSVKNSPTMCSRRIYELLASGVMVVSTHSAAVEQMFKNIVQIVPDYKTMKTSLKFTLNHDDWRVKKELEGQRLIFSSHTYAHRLYTIAKSCGIHVKKPYQINVHVISYAQNRKDVKNILTSYKAQDYSHKKLTIFLSKHFSKKEQAALKKLDHVNFIPVNHVKINLANIIRNTDYVSYFNPKHYYGRYFLTDLVWGSIYSGAKIIGKGSYYKYLRDHKLRLINNSDEYTYTSKVLNDGCIVHKSVINSSDIMLCDLMIQNVFLKKVQAQQKFSINAFNFVYHFDASTKNKALIAKVIK